MKIVIIGWYGTETIGDRAILAGLLVFLKNALGKIEIKLGSLYPFFSERTLREDIEFYQMIIGEYIKIEIFNSRKIKELDLAIAESDIVIMGGGPLMHIEPMYMIEYAFKKAKKLGKKTSLLGCGVGPLVSKKYKKCLINIVDHSDLIILRDSLSMQYLQDIYTEFKRELDMKKIHLSLDPAVQAAIEFIKISTAQQIEPDAYIAINLRKYPPEYGNQIRSDYINQKLEELVKFVAKKYPCKTIRLIPMHYFHIGNDDREFLNEVKFNIGLKNIEVQNKNLTLYETMEIYQKAYFNIGMRFHAVVLQTLINGHNFVLDYTEPGKGKISGFLHDINQFDLYTERYISLQNSNIKLPVFDFNKSNIKADLDDKEIKSKLDIYIECLSEFAE